MNRKSILRVLFFSVFCVAALLPSTARAELSQFNFEGNLEAVLGPAALEFEPGTEAIVTFGTASSFGLPALPGGNAWVMSFPAFSPTEGLRLKPATSANGGGEYVNQYTLIFDLLIPDVSAGWFSFYNTNGTNSNDGDAFLRTDGGIGISGNYQGTVMSNQWHRIAIVWDIDSMYKYIDGVLVGVQEGLAGVDGRWSLYTTDHADMTWLLTDDSSETNAGYISSFLFANEALDEATIAEFGAADADGPAGVRYTVQPDPYNGKELVAVDIDLKWTNTGEVQINAYDVYFGTDPNATSNNYDFSMIVDHEDVTSVDPAPDGNLEYGKTYYWKIDYYEPNAVGEIMVTGKIWSFNTAPPNPVITLDPINIQVDPGGTASLTVEGVNVETYQWYRQGDANPLADQEGKIEGAQSATLTIMDVQVSDEGLYFCVIANEAGSDQSAPARILTRRLIHHWPMDGNADDIIGGLNGIVVGDPNWVPGKADQAIDLIQDEITDSVALGGVDDLSFGEEFDFSISIWVKSDGENVAWGGIISNKDWDSGDNTGWGLFDDNGDMNWNIDGGPRRDARFPAIYDSQWHNICVSNDRKGLAIVYVDGLPVSSADISALGSVDTVDLVTTIGNDAMGNYPFQGTIDDVRIYNYPLSRLEAALIYTDLNPGVDVCLVDDLPFDFNDDCRVDVGDLAIFAEAWLTCERVPSCLK